MSMSLSLPTGSKYNWTEKADLLQFNSLHDDFLLARNTYAEKHSFSDFGTYQLTSDWEKHLAVPLYAKPILQLKITGLDRERRLILGSPNHSKDVEEVEKHLDYYYCSEYEPKRGIHRFFDTFKKYGVERKLGDFCVLIEKDRREKTAFRAQVISMQEETSQVELYLIDKGEFRTVHKKSCWNLIRILSDISPCGIAIKISGATIWPTITIDNYHCEVEIIKKASEYPKAFTAAFTSTALINHQLIEAFMIGEDWLSGPYINHGFTAGHKNNALPKKQNHKNRRELPPAYESIYPTRSLLPPDSNKPRVWDPSSANLELSSTNFSFASQSSSSSRNKNNNVQFMEM